MYNLSVGIYHVHFYTVLTEITAFKIELTFPIKCKYRNNLYTGKLWSKSTDSIFR